MKRPRLRRGKAPLDPVIVALRHAGSIGNLEALAGVAANETDRSVFWEPYSCMPGATGLDAGVAELRRRIITAGVTHRTVEFLRCLRAKAQTYRNDEGMKYWNDVVRIAQARRIDLPQKRRHKPCFPRNPGQSAGVSDSGAGMNPS